MGKARKIITGAVIASMITGGIAAGLNYARIQNIKYATVAPIKDLASTFYYHEDSTFEGHITTNVSQNITLGSDLIVDQVYVGKGDQVKKGDPLVSFDTTISEMKLGIEKLKLLRLENNLNSVITRLERIRAGAALTSENIYGADDEYFGKTSLDEDDAGDDELLDADEDADADAKDPITSFYEEDPALFRIGHSGGFLAAAFSPVTFLASAFGDLFTSDPNMASAPKEDAFSDSLDESWDEDEYDFDEEEDDFDEDSAGDYDYGITAGLDYDHAMEYYTFEGGDGEEEDEEGFTSGGTFTSIDEGFTSGGSVNSGVYTWLTPTPIPGEPAPASTLTEDTNRKIGFSDGQPPFYLVLDADTVPFGGAGTEEDPYVFLCTCAKGRVRLTGGFLNLMAGFNPEGVMVLKEGGYWYQLEFHKYDTIKDFNKRSKSCTGYYRINGALLTEPVDRFLTTELPLEGASTYPDEPDDEADEDDTLPDDTTTDLDEEGVNVTRAEAIAFLEKQVRSLWLDLQAEEISISKLEKVVNRKVIYAKLDGVVAKVGDATKTNTVFMTIKSNEGYYIVGSVSELLRDQMQPGTRLKCSSWYNNSTIEAEVMDLSDYSVTSSSEGGYYGEGNPNVSYYRFTASMTDPDQEVNDTDSLTISIQKDSDSSKGIVLDKAFVRSENGNYYVMKDDNGFLKKQYVKVKEIVNFGSAVLIGGGIASDEKIAFPYGETAVEGTPTKEGASSDLYGEGYF